VRKGAIIDQTSQLSNVIAAASNSSAGRRKQVAAGIAMRGTMNKAKPIRNAVSQSSKKLVDKKKADGDFAHSNYY